VTGNFLILNVHSKKEQIVDFPSLIGDFRRRLIRAAK
jgi:hypothetical protein